MTIRFHLWLGGRFGAVALGGIIYGFFSVIYGATPGEAVAELLPLAPPWIFNPWFKLACVPIGLAIIWASLTYNVWSKRRKVVDELAEILSWAIHDLMNRQIQNDTELGQLDCDFHAWCSRVTKKIKDNPAFFSRADEIHFDRLGRVPGGLWDFAYRATPEDRRHDKLLNMLSLKFDRLRDVINWTQQRTR